MNEKTLKEILSNKFYKMGLYCDIQFQNNPEILASPGGPSQEEIEACENLSQEIIDLLSELYVLQIIRVNV